MRRKRSFMKLNWESCLWRGKGCRVVGFISDSGIKIIHMVLGKFTIIHLFIRGMLIKEYLIWKGGWVELAKFMKEILKWMCDLDLAGYWLNLDTISKGFGKTITELEKDMKSIKMDICLKGSTGTIWFSKVFCIILNHNSRKN